MALNLKITPRQKIFIEAKADEVLFGGAAGGGKSYGQLLDTLLYALKYPGSRQLLLRRSFSDLDKSLIRQHLGLFPREIYKYNSSSHHGRFANHSVVDFGYCAKEFDVYQYQGAEYDVIRFDELTHFTEFQYTYLISRLRGVNTFPKSIRSTTNPGGLGHEWVKKRFITIGAPDTVHKVGETTRLFIPSLVQDNVFLMQSDPGYLLRLLNLSENDQKALLYGDWDLFDGQYFSEFSKELHVIRPFQIPPDWRRYVTIDYGMDMLAAYWVALSPGGRAYVYKELYEGRDNGMGENGKGHIVSRAAQRLKEVNGSDTIYRWLGPRDLWSRNRDTGRSTAEMFVMSDIPILQVKSSRVDGWRSVREWLALATDENGADVPGLQIFSTCQNLIRTLPALQFDKTKTEDTSREPHELTHAPDAIRGFCAYRVSPAHRQETQIDLLRKNFKLNTGRPAIKAIGEGEKDNVV